MNQLRKHYRKRILVLVDIGALLVSYILMLHFRFHWVFKPWQIPLYSTFLITELLISALINVYRMGDKNYKTIDLLDPVELMVRVCQNQVVLLLFLLLELMITQNTYWMSRIALGVIFIGNIFWVYLARIIYRSILIKKGDPDIHRRKLAVFVYAKDKETVIGQLAKGFDNEFELLDVITVDDAYPTDEVRAHGDNAIEEHRNELINKAVNLGCSDVLMCIPDKPENEIVSYIKKDIVKRLGGHGINTYFAMSLDGIWITRKLIRNLGYFQAVYFSAMVKRCRVLGVNFAVSNVENAVLYVRTHIRDFAGKYICYCNVHTTVEASEDEEYMAIQNGSALTFPDGQPIVNRIQKAGFINAERVAGPDFMEAMFSSTMDGKVSHFFYGSSEETIELLKQKLPEKYPGIDIRGYYSPPFRPLTEEEDEEVVRMLNASGADLIWIGLGAPKQEKWMAEHQGKLSGVMLGVGAGFNFFAGNIKRAPVWVQKIGMEWLYRLFQDPKRLFKRYLISNAKFIWKAIIRQGK